MARLSAFWTGRLAPFSRRTDLSEFRPTMSRSAARLAWFSSDT